MIFDPWGKIKLPPTDKLEDILKLPIVTSFKSEDEKSLTFRLSKIPNLPVIFPVFAQIFPLTKISFLALRFPLIVAESNTFKLLLIVALFSIVKDSSIFVEEVNVISLNLPQILSVFKVFVSILDTLIIDLLLKFESFLIPRVSPLACKILVDIVEAFKQLTSMFWPAALMYADILTCWFIWIHSLKFTYSLKLACPLKSVVLLKFEQPSISNVSVVIVILSGSYDIPYTGQHCPFLLSSW